ncbi:flap endonuclease-1 [Nematocida displodere]|uniref:Flap endonuclease 1 n=1 Tax=Nematocida displodere TaxID=1805483 RepID=A0A177EE46_9MICR|nr:flap endonuclease-1 [Nematocida displodere]
MGIHRLSEVIKERAPKATLTTGIEKYRRWKVAIDGSMVIYQTLIAIRYGQETLANAEGNTTAHLQGILYKTVNLLEKGITPVFVFDGAAPELKENVLSKRRELKKKAESALAQATTEQEIEKFAKRAVRATKYHTDTAQALLAALGVPYVIAPGEAEAYCAMLNQTGQVNGVVSEDMDSLAFGATVLLRNFLPSVMKKGSITEITLAKVLEGMELNNEEFIDLCILLGCDYCDSPKGVGPKKAYELIKEHKSIDQAISAGKIQPPEGWKYSDARALFQASAEEVVHDTFQLRPHSPEALTKFLVENNGFDGQKVNNVISRLTINEKKNKQTGLTRFAIVGKKK